MSKEARVAKLYRELVYYPFIRDICTKLGLDPNPKAEVPENLRAISWMDGCLGQLHLITKETVLNDEDILKITCNKQSPARTAVEQAADVGAMFKLIRALIKSMPSGDPCNSHIYHLLVEGLQKLEKEYLEDSEEKNLARVILPSIKRSAILIAGVSKLPEAMGIAFRVSIVKKAFQDNGQIGLDGSTIPNIDAMVGTYRGVIDKDHYLYKTDEIINTYYKEMYKNGKIEEATFDDLNIAEDKDSLGNIVKRNFGIHHEACQRAKVLSSSTQRQARKDQLHSIKVNQHEKHQEAYKAETKKYALNTECESRVITTFTRMNNSINSTIIGPQEEEQIIESFTNISTRLTDCHFGNNEQKGLNRFKPTIEQLKAFIQLRYPIQKFAKMKPMYVSLTKETKPDLIKKCVQCKDAPLIPRHYKPRTRPIQIDKEVTNIK